MKALLVALVVLAGCATQSACRYEAIGAGPQNSVLMLDKITGELFFQNVPKQPIPIIPESKPEI